MIQAGVVIKITIILNHENKNSTGIRGHQKGQEEVEAEAEITSERAEIIIDYSSNLFQSSSSEPR